MKSDAEQVRDDRVESGGGVSGMRSRYCGDKVESGGGVSEMQSRY